MEVIEDPNAEELAEKGEIAFALVGKDKAFKIPGALRTKVS